MKFCHGNDMMSNVFHIFKFLYSNDIIVSTSEENNSNIKLGDHETHTFL